VKPSFRNTGLIIDKPRGNTSKSPEKVLTANSACRTPCDIPAQAPPNRLRAWLEPRAHQRQTCGRAARSRATEDGRAEAGRRRTRAPPCHDRHESKDRPREPARKSRRINLPQIKAAYAKKYAENADAEAHFFKAAKDADAALYSRTQAAEAGLVAQRKEAEATFVAKTRFAEADLIARQKEAQGLIEMAKAYGKLADVLGGPAGLMQWFMLQNGIYERMAEANAKAIQGLQPKINVWNTGPGDGAAAGADSMAPVRNLFQTLPPMLSTIQEQTGMLPPGWLARMPQEQSTVRAGMEDGQLIQIGKDSKHGLVNGHNGVNGVD